MDMWLNHPDSRTAQRMVFDPRGYTPYEAPDYDNDNAMLEMEVKQPDYNLFRGLTVPCDFERRPAPADEECIANDDCKGAQPWIDHVREVWCRNDPALTRYALYWFASVYQQP